LGGPGVPRLSHEPGTTYNAFLVLADKVTLVDTVKKPLRREMTARVTSVVDPKRIDYILSNHSEVDHSGSLPETVEAVT
jgi:flavorubredoxin